MKKILKQNYIAKEDIILEPNEILKQVSEPLTIPLDKDDFKLLRIMYNHVTKSQDDEYAIKNGIRAAVGIAAVQLGVPKRMLAIKTTDEEGKIHKYMLVNPIYKYKSDEISYLANGEGCLSVVEGKYKGIVPRHQHIIVEGYNAFDRKIETIDVSGYVAIVLQHEMDHLDGILYVDKINKLDAFLIKDEWQAI